MTVNGLKLLGRHEHSMHAHC